MAYIFKFKERWLQDFAKISETRNSVLCSEIFSKKITILGIEITFVYFKTLKKVV